MAIARDVETVAAAYSATGTQTTSHVAAASARAACVLIEQNGTVADEVSGVTYGGQPMTRLRFDTETTEAGATYIYWLDGIPGGTQNVAVTTTAATAKKAVICTMTAAVGAAVIVAGHNTGTSTLVANPSWTITGLTAGVKLEAYEVIHSGLGTMTTTPAASWTLIYSLDLGAQGQGFARQSVASASTTLACGWTASTADDFVGSSVAFMESPNATVTTATLAAPAGFPATVVRQDRAVSVTALAAPAAVGAATVAATLNATIAPATLAAPAAVGAAWVPVTLTQSFETVPDGTRISAVNSGGPGSSPIDEVSVAAGCDAVGYSVAPQHGVRCLRITSPGTAIVYIGWTSASLPGLAPRRDFRVYVRISAPGAVTFRLLNILAGTTLACGLNLMVTTGYLRMINAAAGTITTSTVPVATGSWVRVEGWVAAEATGAAGSCQFQIFLTPDSTTPDYDSGVFTGQALGTALVDHLRVGVCNSVATGAVTLDLDDLGFSTAGPLGPAPVPAVDATAAPATVAAPAAVAAVVVRQDGAVAPVVVAAPAAVGAVTVRQDQALAPAAIPAPAGFPTVGVHGGGAAAAVTVAAPAGFPSTVVRQDRAVTAVPVAAPATVGAATVSTAATPAPTLLAAAASFPAAVVRQDRAVTLPALAAPATVGVVVVRQDRVVAAATAPAPAGFPVAAAHGNAAIIPAATLTADATVGPSYATVPQVVIAAGWIMTANNIHLLYGADPALARAFFDGPTGFATKSADTANAYDTNPVQDGLAALPVLRYSAYTGYVGKVYDPATHTGGLGGVADPTGTTQTVPGFADDIANGRITYPYAWILYDTEYWAGTPRAESMDPWSYMQAFADLAHAHGYKLIVTPARDLGNDPASVHVKTSGTLDQWYVANTIAGAAAGADIVVIQTQVDTTNVPQFGWLFTNCAAQIAAASAALAYAEVSTTYGTAAEMITAARSVNAAGFYISAGSADTTMVDTFLAGMRTGAAASPATVAAPAVVPGPTVTAGGNVAVAATTLAAAATVGAAVAHQAATAAPPVAAAPAGFPPVVVRQDQRPTPATLAAPAVAQPVTVSGSVALAPARLTVAATFPPAAAGAGIGAAPLPLAAVAAFPPPTVRQDQAVAALALGLVVVVPAVQARQDSSTTPMVLMLAATITPPAITGGAGAEPLLVAVAAVFPTVVVVAVVTSVTLPGLAAGPPHSRWGAGPPHGQYAASEPHGRWAMLEPHS